MKMLYDVFGKKLYGQKYERLFKDIMIIIVLYVGIGSTDYNIKIAPFILYLISGVFTFGVMLTALNSKDIVEHFKNMLMMPFSDKKLVFSYVLALGSYTLLTKTMIVWALIFAVGKFEIKTIICGILAGICSVLMCSVFYAYRKLRILFIIWSGLLIGSIFGFREMFGVVNAYVMMMIFGVSSLILIIILANTDGYVFYDRGIENITAKKEVKSHKYNLIWTYFYRYLFAHKNYLINTVIMWIVAAFIPFVMPQMFDKPGFEKYIMYMGLGITTLNTPLCILVSCDCDLDRGIKSLPGGIKRFFLPYGLFLFVNICVTYLIYLTFWQIKSGMVDVKIIIIAVIIAALSATLSVIMELFFPIRKWKIESDLWHHPRKYVVPVVVIFIASALGTLIG
ncbi:MAG: hypothetical protein K6E10_01505 [Eubacterium sp.]|nr:hypothetical protein [Eubacterium sp.]